MTLQSTIDMTRQFKELPEPLRPLAQDVLPEYEKLGTKAINVLEEFQSHIKTLHLNGDISYTPKDYVNSVMFDADRLVTDTVDLIIKIRESIHGHSDDQEELQGEETTD